MGLKHRHLHRRMPYGWNDLKDDASDTWGSIRGNDGDDGDRSSDRNDRGRNGEDDDNDNSASSGSGFGQRKEQNREPAAGGSTVYRTVFKTKSHTGKVVGWTTIGADDDKKKATPTHEAKATKTENVKAKATASSTSKHKDVQVAEDSSVPKSLTRPTVSRAKQSQLVLASETPTSRGLVPASTANSAQTLAATSAAATTSSGGSEGVSTGAKAGIAIGVLAGLLAVGVLVYFIFNRRRREVQDKQQLGDDEKVNGPFMASAPPAAAPSPLSSHRLSTQTSATPPRLSLRPITQFFPNLGKRTSQAPAAALNQGVAAGQPAMRPAGPSPWERPMTGESANSANPFGNHAERAVTPTRDNMPTPVSPLSSNGSDDGLPKSNNSAPQVGMAATAVAVAPLARKASTRKDGPKALDLTLPHKMSPVPPSPAGTEFSINSVSPNQEVGPSAGAAAIAAAGGPATTTVHRVQLDFKPTMEDEMMLQAGQLVRLLHEYDDGWALCIRLDRSQQGVVPRTCLSTRPVKPRPAQGGPRGPPVRPNGPPRGPNQPGQRPMTPQGGPNRPRPPMAGPGPRPQSPAGRRPQSPAGRPMSPHGSRPASPANGRPRSPAPRSQSPGPRSQSPSGTNRRNSPPGPSPMNQEYRPAPPDGSVNRKPVPGQAY